MKTTFFLPIFLLLFIISHKTMCFNIDWPEPDKPIGEKIEEAEKVPDIEFIEEKARQPASFFLVDDLMSSIDGDEKKIGKSANADKLDARYGGTVVEVVKSNKTMMILVRRRIVMTNGSFVAAYMIIALMATLLFVAALLILFCRKAVPVFAMNQFAPMAKLFGAEQFEADTVYKPTTVVEAC